MDMHSAYIAFLQISVLGYPATQYQPFFFTTSFLFAASFVLKQINQRHMTSQPEITCPFGRAFRRTLFGANMRALKSKKK